MPDLTLNEVATFYQLNMEYVCRSFPPFQPILR